MVWNLDIVITTFTCINLTHLEALLHIPPVPNFGLYLYNAGPFLQRLDFGTDFQKMFDTFICTFSNEVDFLKIIG